MSTLHDSIVVVSDREILRIIASGDAYTPQARAIALKELERRGGEAVVRERVEAEIERERLLGTIAPVIRGGFEEGRSRDEIVAELAARGADGEDVLDLVEGIQRAVAKAKVESTDTLGSTMKGMVGALISIVIGGISSSFLLFGRERVFAIHGLALMGMCYGLIRWFSGGRRTTWVILLTVSSIILSLVLGQYLHAHGLFTPDPPLPPAGNQLPSAS